MARASFFLSVAAALVSLAGPAAALPDLVPSVENLGVAVRDVLQGDVDEGCAGGRYGRRLVDFSMRTRNVGTSDLVLGNPGCPNCTLNPGATCSNPLFECGTSHGHAHFEEFAKNQILDAGGVVVAEGRKYGFCLLDLECTPPATKQYSCSSQGLTAGCSDVYSKGLPCQYVDITDENLPDGVYTLRVTIDPENAFAESNEANNVVEVPFTIGQTPATCPEYTSSDVPKVIPDVGSVSSTVSVPTVGPVTSLRVRLSGTHTYVGDLTAAITSPSATTRTLFAGTCGAADDFDLYLGDDSVDAFTCPATDPTVVRTPAESFDAFHGEPAAGDWTLTLSDGSANDAGTLDAWSLEVCSLCGNGNLDPGETCDDGNIADEDCCSSDCTTAAADGTACEDGNLCTTAETCGGGTCQPHDDLVCDPCLVCDAAVGCKVPDIVYPCQEPAPGESLVKLRRDANDPARNSVLWRWKSQTPVELDELGAPEVSTDISLCVYSGDTLILSSTVPGGQSCGSGPCWVRGETEARFADPLAQFGLSQIRVREGDSGRIRLKGFGEELAMPPLVLSLPATVRLRRGDGTPCWEAGFDSTITNSGVVFKARSR